MKIAILGSANVIHTVRWVNSLSVNNDVHLVTMHEEGINKISDRVSIHYLPFKSKVGYLVNYYRCKKILSEIRPDILNAHYASGYGLIGTMVNYHPYALSVWGADVYDFPYYSFIHMWITLKNLESSDAILSTSKVMAEQVEKIYSPKKDIYITPFGVDTEIFKPDIQRKSSISSLVVGTVKTLESKYGIDTLIEAFSIVYKSREKYSKNICLKIIGSGSEKQKLQQLVLSLNLSEAVEFLGFVPHDLVPKYLNDFDIYVAVSRLDSESFGVAIIEASACEIPVIVSNVGGLVEVVKDGETGLIVPKEDPSSLADALEALLLDEDRRSEIGRNGRRHVEYFYSWDKCVLTMENVYKEVIQEYLK
jgi:L-malate glycosyltransferase